MTKAEKCARMRAGRARKREALGAVETVTVGWAVFGGPLFGSHRVRIKARADNLNNTHVYVDGRITCAKTQRGARALLMRRIARASVLLAMTAMMGPYIGGFRAGPQFAEVDVYGASAAFAPAVERCDELGGVWYRPSQWWAWTGDRWVGSVPFGGRRGFYRLSKVTGKERGY